MRIISGRREMHQRRVEVGDLVNGCDDIGRDEQSGGNFSELWSARRSSSFVAWESHELF